MSDTKTFLPLPLMPDMVRAYYEDRKSQTRRVLNRNKLYNGFAFDDPRIVRACPYGQPGDRLWIREALVRQGDIVTYAHDGAAVQRHGKPILWPWKVSKLASRYMPYWACRSWAELVAVRVEQVQSITPRDVVAEGVYHAPGEWGTDSEYQHLTSAFGQLWDGINAARGYSWDSNPWVWVLTFKRIAE